MIRNFIFSNDYYKNINNYLIVLLIVFLFFSLYFLWVQGFSLSCIIYIYTTILISISLFLNKRKFFTISYFKKLALFFIIYLNLLHLFIFYSFDFALNNHYFQFSLLTSIPIIFDYKYDKRKIIISLIVTCTVFVLMESYKVIFFNPSQVYLKYSFIKSINISCVIISMFLILYNFLFILEKELFINSFKVNQENFHTNKLSESNEVTLEMIEELIDIAKINSVLFIEKFQQIYPDFFKHDVFYKNDFTTQELGICALAKLGLTTKEIAILNNSTQKAIDSKKYRIKKKLGTTDKFNTFFKNL